MAQRTCPTCGISIDYRKRYCSRECYPPCSVAGCGQPQRKRGWCAAHYASWHKTGEDPKPFQYKWAQGSECEVCGGPVGIRKGFRRHCGPACKQLAHRYREKRAVRPTTFTCRLCRKPIDITRRGRNGRVQRADTVWCRDCGRESPEAKRFLRYGVTPEEYQTALAAGCQICRRIVAVLHIDHDHTCCSPRRARLCGSCNRGFLCGSCNRAIGLLQDSADVVSAAADYLTKAK